MKKTWVLVLIIAFLMVGCSSNNGEKNTNTGAKNNAETSNNTATSKNTETSGATEKGEVSIVFPASLNENGDVAGMTAEVKEAGATNIVENSNGSVTVAISQENLDKLLEKYKSELSTMIEGIHSNANTSSIKDLTYDEETFQEYSLTVDKAAYESEESLDGLVVFGLAMQSMMYQVYSGVAEADIKVTFNFIDASTGEVFETTVLPEATPAQ
ncbi:hypothetical protein PAECIP111893_01224 [Paenibacillus plantiphilus]|uniref:Antigen I/II N-terminal domain-containing protein n=1 Tax=Paenibacillus plantiphilus TaxID=2905650 RepID=A0ABM9C166_9BACL|nr:hypothetical protein [Paenibacillus plantiphilus]CAH1199078.1 hypothetical protein PAECIP111893_01224 [Paenibacillus plantiphilus]